MTTRFPNLPVLGHVPKKRKPNLDATLTLGQIIYCLDAAWMDGYVDDYGAQVLRKMFIDATKKHKNSA